jgi:hypothetical protein
MPEGAVQEVNKPLIVMSLQAYRRGNNLLGALALLGKSTSFPQMCKWNAFTIDSWTSLCDDALGKSFTTLAEGGTD